MFSTFTGNSRRPRNVNLSGQTGNPFANTSWSPAVVSNATKTVSNAQADREKRQAERLRLKAAGEIQRTWRGHRVRRTLNESRRATFDELYNTASSRQPTERLPLAFTLLLSFFSNRRNDDLQRLVLFARDSETVELRAIAPPAVHPSRIQQLVHILVETLHRDVSGGVISSESQLILKLITRIISDSPQTVLRSIDLYYSVLAKLCQIQHMTGDWSSLLIKALSAPLVVGSGDEEDVYRAYAFFFLTNRKLHLFEVNIKAFSEGISAEALANAILKGYSSVSSMKTPKDRLLWLLAHFIDLGRITLDASHELTYLETLYTQLAALSSEISVRVGIKPTSEASGSESPVEGLLQPLDRYVSDKLLSLVEKDGISKLLRDFSTNQTDSSSRESRHTGLLAGYILTLLRCFPSSGDDIRMRLFLEQIPTTSGDTPTVKFLWQIMRQTTIFYKLKTESERPVQVLRRYLSVASDTSNARVEEQEWRIILLFLELYIFILRLSDDEDFFSGIYPQVLQSNSTTSRLRSCSLSMEDVKALTSFLKNTAFSLHYQSQYFSRSREPLEATNSRMDSFLNGASSRESQDPSTSTSTTSPATATRLDLDSLRAIITTAMKMLYERDSRKQFLPTNHWLMTDRLDKEDFINAVIAEEQRQAQEDSDDSDEEKDSDVEAELEDGSGFYSTIAGQRLSRHARMERLRTQQLRALKERRLAEMGPKLAILKHMPFVVPFETRVMIFRQFIHLDRSQRDFGTSFTHPFARHHAQIRRESLFEDAYKNFYQLGEGLKDPIQITFVDQFGTAEAGIDGGGVTKEFLISVTSEAFGDQDSGPGMFTSNEKGLLYPNPTAADTLRESLRQGGISETDPEWKGHMSSLLKRFEFLGRIVGKCMYEGILVDLAFAGFFLLKWASAGPNDENTYKGNVNDLRDMDEELYNGMLNLKNYPGDISELGIDFTITDQISQPGEPVKTIARKLVSNGDQVYVTNDNRLLYISYVARHRLVLQPALQTAAFLRGLRAIIRPSWLSMFNQSELQRLVGGDSSEIDIEDLRANTVYSGLYEIGDDNEEHPTIKLFWKVMRGFTDAQRRDVLKYVSSTPRAPLLGFSQLKPKFSIRDGGTDESRLPSTSTCVNLLKLPRYTVESTLRAKLLYAVTSGAGFDLS
ncbi:Fc.00g039630.m01.CDS01 [Cosmosporella sp. VM-42]